MNILLSPFLYIGTWGIGLATRRANLSKVPMGTDTESWIMDQYGQVKHDDKVLSQFRTTIDEGDVIVSFVKRVTNQFEVSFRTRVLLSIMKSFESLSTEQNKSHHVELLHVARFIHYFMLTTVYFLF